MSSGASSITTWLSIAVPVLLLGGVIAWQVSTGGVQSGGKGEDGEEPAANPCDDQDPCTVDRWHRFQDRCIHVPDALCDKPCQSAADCEYPGTQCLSSTCFEGSCRYIKIAVSECFACGPDAPCQGTFCDPRQCKDGFCRHAPKSCDDGDPTTRDSCDPEAGQCKHEPVGPPRACQGGDCGPRQCRKNTDCIQMQDGVCHAGPCEAGWCKWRNVDNSQCQPCTGDHDCKGSFCNWPICTGTVCVTEQVPFCADDNPLTQDLCSENVKGCLHRYTQPPPVCAGPPEDDDDAGTVDLCHSETGKSVHLPAAGGDCRSTNLCWDTYPGPDGYCLGRELDCHHDDACPAECRPEAGCVLDANRDCHCETHADCDLGNPCAKVFGRDEDGGACWGTFIDNCIPCQADVDCRVDNWCVLGTCAPDGYCVYRDGYTCDDNNHNTFGFCHGQRDDPCTYEAIYDYN